MVSKNGGSETSGSGSSSVSEDSINVSFDDIKFSVRNGLFSRGRKEILKGVSGTFNAGELTVIMGQSGAGKSTLIDILAGYTKPSSGNIFVNGQPRDDQWFRRRSCYIMQDCLLHEMLTVRESLMVAANLKLGQHVSRAQKIKRVEEVTLALGLSAAVNTRAGNLSGGQKKRLAISLELVSDPRVMVIDEPTSGLDSSLSKQLVYLLHLLAGQGRTVIVSIHQPSAGLLQMMDRIYAVMAGRCAYNGSVTQLVPYLNHLGLVCPPFHNPVDFLIETYSENEERLVQAAQSGRNAWISDISTDKDMLAFNISSKLNEELCISALPTLKESRTNKLLLRIQSTYSTSRWRQFSTLTKKSFLTTWRDPTHSLMNILIHASMALFVGTLFYDIGEDASFIRDNFNFLYFSLMFIMFTSFSAVSINFPQEIPVVRREHFNRWYSASSYYAATIASCLPKHTIGALIYACLTFWMTGQPSHMLRFLGFSAMLTAVSYVSMFVGFLNGSMFNVKNGVIFGPFILMPLTIFSGFFLRLVDAPSYIKWFFHASFLKHGLVGLLLSIFGMDRPKMPCSDLYCHYAHPKQFLEDNGCSKESYANAMLALFLTSCSVAICSFWVLKIRLRRKW